MSIPCSMIRMTNISKNDFALVVNLFLVKGFREFRFDLSLDNFIFKWIKPWTSTIFNILKKRSWQFEELLYYRGDFVSKSYCSFLVHSGWDWQFSLCSFLVIWSGWRSVRSCARSSICHLITFFSIDQSCSTGEYGLDILNNNYLFIYLLIITRFSIISGEGGNVWMLGRQNLNILGRKRFAHYCNWFQPCVFNLIKFEHYLPP